MKNTFNQYSLYVSMYLFIEWNSTHNTINAFVNVLEICIKRMLHTSADFVTLYLRRSLLRCSECHKLEIIYY